MLERPLRYLAIALSLIIAIGFSLYALEDIGHASEKSEQRILGGYAATSPSPAGERERERRHGQPREMIDDVNDVLLSPFAGVSETAKSGWTRRGVPALIGLAIYGFGLGYAARFMTARGGSAHAAPTG
ncbi:MAG: hypothetical protein QOI64_699 [Solirubrobacteraceae bacterium]|nr:hypothetical protein [Solirubrobacteraceae bacterium]